MVLIPILNPGWGVLYYEALVLLLMGVAFVQLKLMHDDRVWVEVLLFSADFSLLTFILLVPSPFGVVDAPLTAQFSFVEFGYFFLYLALGTLAYSWRAIRIIAVVGAMIWLSGVVGIWTFSQPHPSGPAFRDAMADFPVLRTFLDPESIRVDARVREIVIFAMVAFILSVTVKRFGDLLLTHVSVARERTNLSRYFSPNMIEELSANDEPLREIRVQDVAVLFVDMIGFTAYANRRSPEDVVHTLREFHGLMAQAIFDNNGTLDKFLGDGVMATFGTPKSGKMDASSALRCARAMIDAVNEWNVERESRDLEQLKIGVGLHYGPCVLGDIGDENRLEFAVIGDTVNIASRVEAKTRELGVNILVTADCADEIHAETEGSGNNLSDFRLFKKQEIRGVSGSMDLYGC